MLKVIKKIFYSIKYRYKGRINLTWDEFKEWI